MAIRLGIIGMGYTGRQHRRTAAGIPALEVTAAADTADLAHLPELAGIAFHRDWRRLVDDPNLDAVSICLPHAAHAEVALAAIAAGKHVLLEKPIAATVEEARAVVAAAERARRVLLVEMTHRFYPPLRAVRELVVSGRVGKVLAVEDRIVSRFTGTGLLAPWMIQRAVAGGGLGLTDGIHMVDRVAFMTAQPLHFISGTAGASQRLGDVEDTAAMHLRLADGTPVQVLAIWCLAGSGLDDELTLHGVGGTLRVWAWRGWRFEPAGAPPEQHESYAATDDHFARARAGMHGALAEFAAAVAENRPPSPHPREVLAAQEIIAQFYAATGR